jgi:lysozyme
MPTRRQILSGLASISLLGDNCCLQAQTISTDDGIDISRREIFEIEVAADIKDFGAELPEAQQSYALTRDFNFSGAADGDPKYDRRHKVVRTNSHFGIDVSKYQKGIDFSDLRSQGVEFAYTQASQGAHVDPQFDVHWRALSQLDPGDQILRGAYHFLRPSPSGEEQAQFFCDTVERSGGWRHGDLTPVLDVESTNKDPTKDAWLLVEPTKILSTITDFMAALQQRKPGIRPIIYTGRSWWTIFQPKSSPNSLALPPELGKYRIWISDWGRRALKDEIPSALLRSDGVLWQFTDSATVSSGYDQFVDASVFYGTTDQLASALVI